MNRLKYGLVVLFMLAGCSVLSPTHYASSDKQQYLKSQNGPALVVPQALSKANISEFYHLPDQHQNTRVSIVPPSE